MPASGYFCEWRPDRLLAKIDMDTMQPIICDRVGRFPTKSY